MSNITVTKQLKYEDARIVAGAVGCAYGRLAVGTYNGFALFTFPSLGLLLHKPDEFAEHIAPTSVQLTVDSLILLVNLERTSQIGDWKTIIKSVSLTGDELGAGYSCGPGNWRLVPGLTTHTVIVYDSSENHGVFSMDTRTGGKNWHLPIGSLDRLVGCNAHSLVGLNHDHELIYINSESGALEQRFALPSPNNETWTSVNLSGGMYLLGGYSNDRSSYVILALDAQSRATTWGTESPISNHFSDEQINYALADEECCGADIHHVSNIFYSVKQDAVVCTLGGHGQRLGACQGVSAVALVERTPNTKWRSMVLDQADGNSGLLSVDDRTFVAQCFGAIRVVEIR